MKKSYTPKQKASIALMAVKGEPISKLASLHQIHPTQIGLWKKFLETEAEKIFSDKRKKENFSKDRMIEELYKTIGQRDMEIEWLKKKFNLELPREISFD
jgi:putative transposase